MKDVRGKVVVITGAALGMGKLLAKKFVADGARTVMVDLNPQALSAAVSELGGPEQGAFEYIADITDRGKVLALRQWVHGEFGTVDVLVNNAGIVAGGPFLKVPIEKHLRTIDVNVSALISMTHAFLPDMIEKRAGHLIMLASAAGFVGVPALSSYCASKWAVIGFSESVRLELEREGITGVKLTIVCPSYVDTGMFAGAKAPLLTPMLKPEEIVESIYRGFKQDKLWVIEPAVVKTIPAMKALLPTPIVDRIGALLGMHSSMDEWVGRRN